MKAKIKKDKKIRRLVEIRFNSLILVEIRLRRLDSGRAVMGGLWGRTIGQAEPPFQENIKAPLILLR